MATFKLSGVTLNIPGHVLNPNLKKALQEGRYEWNERLAVTKNVQPGDRVLDIGAGAGFVSCLCAKVVGGENLTSVEALPDMVPVVRRNLNLNGAGDASVLHGAVVADGFDGDEVRFKVATGFWSSSISTQDSARDIVVPVLRFSDLMRDVRPSVVIMDIEGGEVDICQQDWPDHVRLLIMEIHTRMYSAATLKAVFDGMSRNGFTYYPWGTRGEVVVLQRVNDA